MQRMRSQARMYMGGGEMENRGRDIRCVAAEVQMKRPSRAYGREKAQWAQCNCEGLQWEI